MRIIGTFQRKGAIHDRFEARSACETFKPMFAEALCHRVLFGLITTARVQIETNERKIESTAQVSFERTLLISSHHSFA
jgi:hypothetical protein